MYKRQIFIAQPPLYKISKGKQQSYLKDEAELDSFFTQVALENAELYINDQAPAIKADALGQMVTEYKTVMAMIDRLSKIYPTEALERLIHQQPVSEVELKDSGYMHSWCEALEQTFTDSHKAGQQSYSITVKQDLERGYFIPEIAIVSHGITSNYQLGHDFFNSAEYRSINQLSHKIAELIEPSGFIKRGDKRQEIADFPEALHWLMSEAKRGFMIQRYKGLGEMNPDQLWETTMDPEVRRMLVVTIEDAIAADQIFTTLMGDQVEPRREFIEKNALSVANLDV